MDQRRDAGAAATKEDMELAQRLHRVRKPPEVEPAAECHYCHLGMLERRHVGMLVFYACSNEEGCCLMFWRKPRGLSAPDNGELEH